MPQTIKLEEAAQGVAVIAFDRPDAANALSTRMGEELLEAWRTLSAREDVLCVILRGEGRHFQAGADLKERNGMDAAAWAAQHRIFEAMIQAQLDCPAIVIAAVHGAAMGGGAEIALAADFAYAATDARFALPEVTLGIMPGLGGTQTLSRAIGPRRALELLVTGRVFTAEEALTWGVVNAVVEPPALLPTVLGVAGQIAANAPLSVRALKKAVRGSGDLGLAAGMALEIVEYDRLVASADRREGVAAFNEKRTPEFRGR
jgi:enoyl-CoA hydratase/carnithine racemase